MKCDWLWINSLSHTKENPKLCATRSEDKTKCRYIIEYTLRSKRKYFSFVGVIHKPGEFGRGREFAKSILLHMPCFVKWSKRFDFFFVKLLLIIILSIESINVYVKKKEFRKSKIFKRVSSYRWMSWRQQFIVNAVCQK